MLKSQVPFYFCSLACIVLPPRPYPGQPVTTSTKEVAVSANRAGRTSSTASKKNKIALTLTNKQGMKFVSTYIRENDKCLHTVEKRSEGPFTIIDSVLNHYGLPLELKYLAVIESELKPSAVSRVGAKGPWQLMPGTAHELGLKVNRRADDRTNYYMSTRAAARYLRDLHHEFGDWLLVLAAYNGGPVPVYKAIHKSHSRNFWTLQRYLPQESRDHVKKFIATAYYFETMEKKDAQNGASAVIQVKATVAPAMNPKGSSESDDQKFARLMNESAAALKASNETLKPATGN
jgi:hypothetical protein